MANNITVAKVVLAVKAAENGVDYSPRLGALCPWCGKKAKVYSTKKWDGPYRIRYHRCETSRCLIKMSGGTIKSLEVDLVQMEG